MLGDQCGRSSKSAKFSPQPICLECLQEASSFLRIGTLTRHAAGEYAEKSADLRAFLGLSPRVQLAAIGHVQEIAAAREPEHLDSDVQRAADPAAAVANGM